LKRFAGGSWVSAVFLTPACSTTTHYQPPAVMYNYHQSLSSSAATTTLASRFNTHTTLLMRYI